MKKEIKSILSVVLGLAVITLVVVFMPYATKLSGKASGQNASLVVNYEGIIGEMPRPWRNLAQGGEESKDMLHNVTGNVARLKPEYIRIDHIFDAFEVVRSENGQIKYDWSRLDEAVNTILKTGAKPFLALSYMPSAISSGDVVSMPKNMNDWKNLVRECVERYSGRGQKNIDGVIYEVWNEPDLFGKFKTYGEKNYLTLYRFSVEGALEARNTNKFEIGGPATTAPYQNWVEKLIIEANKNNWRLDFVSWHRYSKDMTVFQEDIKKVREWTENIPAFVDLKFYVTEWGFDSENNDGYDGNFGAIHTLAGARAMTGVVDRAFVFEIKDGVADKKYYGRWGLMTHEKHGEVSLKPRYRALEFLNALETVRIGVTGEGSYVSALASMAESGDLKVLVTNYDPKGKHAESVPIRLENLPSGSFVWRRKDFMGGERKIDVATDSASWQTREYFAPNTAAIFSAEF